MTKPAFSESSESMDTVRRIWTTVGLSPEELAYLRLTNSGTAAGTPSTYKIGHIAQATVALSTLAAASIQAARLERPLQQVQVDQKHALVEFKSERFNLLDGKLPPSPWGPVGGLHKVQDGYVRIHDSFPHHAKGAAEILGTEMTREKMAEALKSWKKVEFENAAVEKGVCCVALRSEQEWNDLPHSSAISDFPVAIELRQEVSQPQYRERWNSIPRTLVERKPLAGIRVVEFSRVIAAPLAGKTLAVHGADVIWITAPHLPDLPALDREFSRGKRTVQLDIRQEKDMQTLLALVSQADVFMQSYRPDALSSHGLSFESISKVNPDIVYATLSAYGNQGPWAKRRGFDSLVQTVSGMNAEEALAEGLGNPARVTPVQALDHAGGYMLAFGIMAALRKRLDQPGAYKVETSLAQVMKLLKSLGRLPKETLKEWDPSKVEEVAEYMDEHDTQLGHMQFIRHAGRIEGADTQWSHFPKPLGSDKPEWLS